MFRCSGSTPNSCVDRCFLRKHLTIKMYFKQRRFKSTSYHIVTRTNTKFNLNEQILFVLLLPKVSRSNTGLAVKPHRLLKGTSTSTLHWDISLKHQPRRLSRPFMVAEHTLQIHRHSLKCKETSYFSRDFWTIKHLSRAMQ